MTGKNCPAEGVTKRRQVAAHAQDKKSCQIQHDHFQNFAGAY
jgi:hypothetical protein